MKCANCGIEASAGATECAGCGVIFAKLMAKKERVALEAKVGLVASEAPALPILNPWKARAAAAGFVAFWFVSLGLYYRHAVAVRALAAKKEVRERPTVMIRDPQTGNLRPLPVVKSPSTGRKYGEAPGD